MDSRRDRESSPRRQHHNESDVDSDDEPYSPYRGLLENERKRLERNRILESIRYSSTGQSLMTVRQILDYMRSSPYVPTRSNDERRSRITRTTNPSANQQSSTETNAASASSSSNSDLPPNRTAEVRPPMPRRRLNFQQAREMGMPVDEFYGHILCKRSKYEKKIEENNVMKHMKKRPVPIVFSDTEEKE